MLVGFEEDWVGFFLRDWNWLYFLGEKTVAHGGCGALLASEGKGVLVFARDMEFFGDDFGRLGHGVDAVFCFHQRIDEAPAERGVFGFQGTGESGIRFA